MAVFIVGLVKTGSYILFIFFFIIVIFNFIELLTAVAGKWKQADA